VSERVLGQRDLNRALLARQMLLERVDAPLPRVLERMGGLQAQYAPSMYIGLWTRVAGFERADLTRALERHAVVQGWLMRTTIHLVSRRDYWPFAMAVRAARRAWWLKVRRDSPSEDELVAAARLLRERLARGPLRRSAIEALLGKEGARGIGLWIDLVRAPPSGTWERRRADLYADAERWIGPPKVGEQEAVEHVLRRYLRGFGPAGRADAASWSGLPRPVVDEALDRLHVRRLRDAKGQELLDLPRAPLPDPDTPAPVRFLATWDATLLTHARRTGILPEEHRPKIFSSRHPQSFPTFLVDGHVAGTWRHRDGRIELEPFGRLDAATRRELRAEADGLRALHA
jgi:winged helix DNA-binding protein